MIGGSDDVAVTPRDTTPGVGATVEVCNSCGTTVFIH